MRALLAILIAAAAITGCASPPAAERWPVDRMLDPVTEETPNVRTE